MWCGPGWAGGWWHGGLFPLLMVAVLGVGAVALLRSRKSEGVRSSSEPCSECGASIHPTYFRCPQCGHSQKTHCPTCSRVVDTHWRFCPYCSEELQTAAVNPSTS